MLSKLFNKVKSENRSALITFVSCGDPTIAFSERLIERICKSGADIVEIGVPFSDPMADGKVIESASKRAIASGTTLEKVIAMVKRLRNKGVENPFVLFSYYNPIYKYGLEKVASECVDARIDAMIVVDVPLEESEEITSVISPKGINFIPLASPMTSLERIENMTASASGFLYYVSVAGVTGVRGRLPEGIADRLADVRKVSHIPVAIGFGISTPEMASEASKIADAVVVGSRIVAMAHENLVKYGEEFALDEIEKFVKSLSEQMRHDL